MCSPYRGFWLGWEPKAALTLSWEERADRGEGQPPELGRAEVLDLQVVQGGGGSSYPSPENGLTFYFIEAQFT